ncbi:hypothetical protein ACFVXC_05540 [Streptomyces sp. NPDC058257]|uniref:hypothetical protein n=1 Tax=Streptomyces sp. NPDC058257 TaxID=3346409 RepID=UPI0036E47E99
MAVGKPVLVHVQSHGDWYGVWHGREYINVFTDEDVAKNAAISGNLDGAVHVINTSLDGPSGDPEAYVREQVEAWAAEDGADFRANM